MSSVVQLAFERLKGRENFNIWKVGAKAHLITKGCWTHMIQELEETPKPEVKTANQKALAELILLVDSSIYPHLEHCETAKSAWDTLVNAFEDKGVIRKVSLLKQWISLKLDDCLSMQDYINKCLAIKSKLTAAGFKIDEEIAASIMLCGLPEAFKPMVMSIETKAEITVDYVKNILLQEVEFEKDETALVVKRSFNKKKSFQIKKNEKHIKCFNCGGPHFQRQCPNNKKKDFVLYSSFLAQENLSCSDWYLDSGASAHMTKYESILKNKTVSSHQEVTVANNNKLQVKCIGNVEQEIKVKNEVRNLKINKVQYIPDLCVNLLSVSQIVKNGNTVMFDKHGFEIRDKNKIIVATGSLVNDMFKLHIQENCSIIKDNDEKCMNAFACAENETKLWHRRLAHTSFTNMRFLKGTIENVNYNEQQCDICIKGKQSRLPFKLEGHRAKQLLEIIHSDVCGPMSVSSLSGYRYFVTFIDDYSRKVFVYVIKNKNEIFKRFVEFKSLVENQTGRTIKVLRTDNGTEYVNSAFQMFTSKHGIIHQKSAPYTPQQNGMSERMNRTLVEKVRCMLIDAEMSKSFWAEAVMAAAKIVNCVPCKGTKDISPEEVWSGRKPDMNIFKVFGCKAFVHIPNAKRKKLDEKSIECVFVGYASESKAYRLYDKSTKKLIISRNVSFMETSSPKKSNTENVIIVEPPEEESHDDSKMIGLEDDSLADEPDVTIISNKNEETADPTESNENSFESTIDSSDWFLEQSRIPDNLEQPRREPSSRIAAKEKPNYACVSTNFIDPSNVKEAMSGNSSHLWKEAMEQEMTSLYENGTWELAPLPEGKRPVKCKWIFKTKYNSNGDLVRHKARLVAKGFSQIEGIDYNETFSPVVRYTSIRFLLALAVKFDLKISQMDAVSAFLNGKLDTEVYMEQPELFNDSTNRYCKLKKSIYGLKQSSRLWNDALNSVLLNFGLKRSNTDQCIFYSKSSSSVLIVAIYVDDLIILSNDVNLENKLKRQLCSSFQMKDLGQVASILGMRITQNDNSIAIDQSQYICEVIERFGMSDAKPISSPLDVNQKISAELCPKVDAEKFDMKNVPYKEAIGSLLYAAQVSRPDINFAVNLLSRYSENPGKAHWTALKRVLRYLKGTINQRIVYRKSNDPLKGYCDADWAGDVDNRKSTTGYIFIMQNAPISWCTRKQPTVALSTTEAEFMAMVSAIQESIWLKNLEYELFPTSPKEIDIYCDNKGAILLANNNTYSPRTKHMDIKGKFIREKLDSGNINIKYISTDSMFADSLTKATTKLGLTNFQKLLN